MQAGKSSVGRLMRDPVLFWEIFELFRYEHFRSRDNGRAGLSMRNIMLWYPAIADVGIHPFLFIPGIRH